MISVQEAREAILTHISPLPPSEVTLWQALGRVLAEDVVALVNVPPFALRGTKASSASAKLGPALRRCYKQWATALHASACSYR